MGYMVDADEFFRLLNVLKPVSGKGSIIVKTSPDEVTLHVQSPDGYLTGFLPVLNEVDSDEEQFCSVPLAAIIPVLTSAYTGYTTYVSGVELDIVGGKLNITLTKEHKDGYSDRFDGEYTNSFSITPVPDSQRAILHHMTDGCAIPPEVMKLICDIVMPVMADTGNSSKVQFNPEGITVSSEVKYSLNNALANMHNDEVSKTFDGVELKKKALNMLKSVLDTDTLRFKRGDGKEAQYLQFAADSLEGGLRFNKRPDLVHRDYNGIKPDLAVQVDRRYLVDVLSQIGAMAATSSTGVFLEYAEDGLRVFSGSTSMTLPYENIEGDLAPYVGIRARIKADDVKKALLGSNDNLITAEDIATNEALIEQGEPPIPLASMFMDKVLIKAQSFPNQVKLVFTDSNDKWRSWSSQARIINK